MLAVDTGGPTGSARPRITSLSYTPGSPKTTDHIRLQVKAEDPDGTPLHYRYTWYINDKKQVHLTRDNLPAASFSRGDTVFCEVRAIDRDGDEAMRRTAEIEIANSRPSFTTDTTNVRKLDGLQLRANDPDGDKITFKLTGAPAGMTIDKDRGVIRYKGSTKEKGGAYQLEVTADDGEGATTTWQFGINVSAGSAGTKAEAPAKDAKAPGEDAEAGGEKKRERRRTAW